VNLADAGIIARLRGSAKALKADIGADLLEVPVGPSQRQHYVLPLPLCWLARYSQVIAFAAALLAGLPGKNSATPAMFARDWQIFKFIVAHDFYTDQLAYHSFKNCQDCDRLEVSDFGSVRCDPTSQKRRCCQRRSSALTRGPAHFDWRWGERPALAWEA
jgi:hypothetical protein